MLKGPAGTGKTYLALGFLLHMLDRGQIDKVIISDYSGKKLLEKSLNGSQTINVQSLVKGTYLIQVFTEKDAETIKFIKD